MTLLHLTSVQHQSTLVLIICHFLCIISAQSQGNFYRQQNPWSPPQRSASDHWNYGARRVDNLVESSSHVDPLDSYAPVPSGHVKGHSQSPPPSRYGHDLLSSWRQGSYSTLSPYRQQQQYHNPSFVTQSSTIYNHLDYPTTRSSSNNYQQKEQNHQQKEQNHQQKEQYYKQKEQNYQQKEQYYKQKEQRRWVTKDKSVDHYNNFYDFYQSGFKVPTPPPPTQNEVTYDNNNNNDFNFEYQKQTLMAMPVKENPAADEEKLPDLAETTGWGVEPYKKPLIKINLGPIMDDFNSICSSFFPQMEFGSFCSRKPRLGYPVDGA